MKQWFLAITKFADELHSDLKILEENGNWPSRVVDMQRNWLGRSEGFEVPFQVPVDEAEHGHLAILCFTTRLDTLPGVQFLALSLNHPLVREEAAHNGDLQAFIESAPDLPEDSKAGFPLPKLRAINPMTHVDMSLDSKPWIEGIPLYAAPYVSDDYGTGAVMGVPAHDIRDHAFWKQNQPNEPIRSIINPMPKQEKPPKDIPFTAKGMTDVSLGILGFLPSDEAAEKIRSLLKQADTPKRGRWCKAIRTANWRLRDWLISRQRYWGAPIPIIHCHSCGPVSVPVQDLPVELPKLPPGQFKGRNGNPLEQIEEWVNTTCPKCNGPAKRDTDTMDTFMDSSWYFFRFADPSNIALPVDSKLAEQIMPVDFYIGGVEHAILHLLYARFIAKFLADKRGGSMWPIKPNDREKTPTAEPFKRLIAQGMVHGKTYSDPSTGRFLKPDEVDLVNHPSPIISSTGVVPNVSFEKMSKSKYNGVDPGSCISKYGADVTRAHMLFAAPESEVLEWEEERVSGITRWLTRVWHVTHVANKQSQDPSARVSWVRQAEKSGVDPYTNVESSLLKATADTVFSVTTKLQSASGFNTVVSDLIKLTNQLFPIIPTADAGDDTKVSPNIYLFCTETLIQLAAPLAPAFAEETWQILHQDGKMHFDAENCDFLADASIFDTQWPEHKDIMKQFASTTQTFVFSVNGKKKFDVTIPVPNGQLQGEALKTWLLKTVLEETEQGVKWMSSHQNRERLDTCERIVIGNNGKIMNLVMVKSKNEERKTLPQQLKERPLWEGSITKA